MRRLVLCALLVALTVLMISGCDRAERVPGENASEQSQPRQESARTGQSAQTTGPARATQESSGRSEDGTAGRAKSEKPADEPEADAQRSEPAFTADPNAEGGETGAAQRIAEVRFGRHEGYERAVIEFDSPRVPRWTFSSPTGEAYSRLSFPGLQGTAVSDGAFGGSIMDDLYVVRAPEGGFFVDVFATGAFQYRLLELENPGRLAIDYRPAGVEPAFPLPVRGDLNVVMQPRTGEAVSSPLVVSGYSRNFEASTTLILRGASGEVLASKTVLANDYLETWGYFAGTLEFPPFQGQATLQVGAPSARDGTFQGIEVPVVYAGQ